jgi:hypothetical protein
MIGEINQLFIMVMNEYEKTSHFEFHIYGLGKTNF